MIITKTLKHGCIIEMQIQARTEFECTLKICFNKMNSTKQASFSTSLFYF